MLIESYSQTFINILTKTLVHHSHMLTHTFLHTHNTLKYTHVHTNTRTHIVKQSHSQSHNPQTLFLTHDRSHTNTLSHMHSIAHLRTHSNAKTQSQRYMESYIRTIPTQTHSSHLYTFRYTLSDVHKHSLTHLYTQRHELHMRSVCVYTHLPSTHVLTFKTYTDSHTFTQAYSTEPHEITPSLTLTQSYTLTSHSHSYRDTGSSDMLLHTHACPQNHTLIHLCIHELTQYSLMPSRLHRHAPTQNHMYNHTQRVSHTQTTLPHTITHSCTHTIAPHSVSYPRSLVHIQWLLGL